VLIHRLHGLHIDRGDDQIVGVEDEFIAHLASLLVNTKDRGSNESCAVLVEVVEANGRNGATDAGGNGLASIAYKVRHREELAGVFLVLLVDTELPRVR